MGSHSAQVFQLSFSVSREANKCFKMVDDAKVKYICDIYDWDGKGEIDLFFLGDVMYALGLNITKKVCVGLGQTDEEGKKFAKYDVQKLFAELCDPEDEDGLFPYMSFLDRLTGKAYVNSHSSPPKLKTM